MALPTSGTLSIEDIAIEFASMVSHTHPDSLSEYYGVVPGIPTVGNPISINDFYGASAETYNYITSRNATIQTYGGYRYHTWQYSPYGWDFNVIALGSASTCEYLIIAGGGGNGTNGGGGGGAGGLRTGSFVPGLGRFSVVVGAGTTGTGGASYFYGPGISTTSCNGGGKGAVRQYNLPGGNGGSGGGGGSAGYSNNVAGSGTSGQGYNGGAGAANDYGLYGTAGGGGGRGGAGYYPTHAYAPNQTGGRGGNGFASSITGSSVLYAGGGSGSGLDYSGGGGGSGYVQPGAGGGGLNNGNGNGADGKGGGGGNMSVTGVNAGTVGTQYRGGNGIMILRYRYQ